MSNPDPLEKDIEKRTCEYARSKNCLCYKFTSPSRRSVPDRLFITPHGLTFFVEFKRRGQKPTPAQCVEIDKIKRHGVPVGVIDSMEAGKTLIDAMVQPRTTFTMEDF